MIDAPDLVLIIYLVGILITCIGFCVSVVRDARKGIQRFYGPATTAFFGFLLGLIWFPALMCWLVGTVAAWIAVTYDDQKESRQRAREFTPSEPPTSGK